MLLLPVVVKQNKMLPLASHIGGRHRHAPKQRMIMHGLHVRVMLQAPPIRRTAHRENLAVMAAGPMEINQMAVIPMVDVRMADGATAVVIQAVTQEVAILEGA